MRDELVADAVGLGPVAARLRAASRSAISRSTLSLQVEARRPLRAMSRSMPSSAAPPSRLPASSQRRLLVGGRRRRPRRRGRTGSTPCAVAQQQGQRLGRVEVVGQRLDELGRRARPVAAPFGGRCRASARSVARALLQPVDRPVDRLAVMRAQHGEAQHLAVPAPAAEGLGRQQLADGDEVAERLRHLLAFHLQEAVVHPDVAPCTSCRRRSVLCATSFSWCGKTRSMPPPWMSKTSPRCFQLMAEHSMCQPGRPRPQRAVPARLARRGGLPQHEVRRHRACRARRRRARRRSSRRASGWRARRSAARRESAIAGTLNSTWPSAA